MDGNYYKRRSIVAQNMMTSEHKTTNEVYRINYDLIFRKKKKVKNMKVKLIRAKFQNRRKK